VRILNSAGLEIGSIEIQFEAFPSEVNELRIALYDVLGIITVDSEKYSRPGSKLHVVTCIAAVAEPELSGYRKVNVVFVPKERVQRVDCNEEYLQKKYEQLPKNSKVARQTQKKAAAWQRETERIAQQIAREEIKRHGEKETRHEAWYREKIESALRESEANIGKSNMLK